MINFNLNNASYFDIIGKKIQTQIKIKLKYIVLFSDELDFCYWCFFFK